MDKIDFESKYVNTTACGQDIPKGFYKLSCQR